MREAPYEYFEMEDPMPASPPSMLKEKPLAPQVGGSHYKATKIQPIEAIWEMLKENPLATQVDSALEKQIGGSHYKATKIQPIEVIWDWDLGFELGSALKYIQRHKNKGGVEDIKKAIHYLELYTERYLKM